MTFNSHDIDYEELTKTLAESFNLLADEVQLLSDRKIILEHKLRFAHEQYQQLADKYALGDVEIANTLAKLQLPQELQPSTPDRAAFVPLPRSQTLSKQHTAEAIRDGRRAVQRIKLLNGQRGDSTVSGRTHSGTSSLRYSARRTSLSTVLEQDFTVLGKQSPLHCPFSKAPSPDMDATPNHALHESGREEVAMNPVNIEDPTPHQSKDPICAALYTEITASAPPSATGSAPKCPIRYLDQHSPEEVAAYFETHKHEIPRSHEVCVRRYQRNEADIRKLDAKYGNLVNMIQGLGQKHQPMLATKEDEDSIDLEHISNDRVESWAQDVSPDIDDADITVEPTENDDRESRFDRPLKEIRVGESPSRPWGISVPVFDAPVGEPPESPSPAPVSVSHMPKASAGKCPFGHGQVLVEATDSPREQSPPRPTGKCPFGHGQPERPNEIAASMRHQSVEATPSSIVSSVPKADQKYKEMHESHGPAFINPTSSNVGPQMIFTGPVFIGYTIEDAVKFMSLYKGQ